MYLAGDRYLCGAFLAEIESDGCAILRRRPNAEGVAFVVHDMLLRRD